MKSTKRELKRLTALQEATCIYRAKGLVRVVKVTKARIDEWGVAFWLEVIPSAGFIDDEKRHFFISCCWDYLNITSGIASMSGYVGWKLFFRADLVDRIRKFAKKNVDFDQLIRFIYLVERTTY